MSQDMTGTMPPGGMQGTSTRWRDLLLALAIALFSFGSAWISLEDTALGVSPDEWAHATYVHEIATEGRLIPDYAGSQILPGESRGNYLNHPPLYYSVLGLTGRALGWAVVADYGNYRALSAVMAALGIFLWMLTGRGLGMPTSWLIAIAAATNAIPMVPFLAGSINNDNLAYLGVAIAFYGLVQLRYWPRIAPYIGALGVLTTFLSKATAALFLCLFFVIWALPQLRHASSPLRNRHLLAALAGVALISSAYYLYAIFAYGSPFPNAMALYPPNPPAHPLSFWSFAAEFTRQMMGRLPTITSHASLSPLDGWGVLFWVMLAAPLLAWLLSAYRSRRAPDAWMTNAFMLALATSVLAHVLVVWNSHLNAGVLSGMQPRYYGYALPAIFIFCFLQSRNAAAGKALLATFALAAALLLSVAPSMTTRLQVRAQLAANVEALRYPAATGVTPLDVQLNLNGAQAGYVDSITVSDGTARLRGWAANKADLTPAPGILVLTDGQVVGTARTGKPRLDVAEALGSKPLASSGFQFSIDNLPPGTTPCDIRLLAEQSDGSMAQLSHAGCAPPAP
ncbi:hypothetical protein WCE37_11475 [Luteimonas sp. MJ250]|uniref:hypothetical protein n=1 Tax=Luteimonas sp. MJ250 TaxID=3129236 RepID=UPI0031BB3EE5